MRELIERLNDALSFWRLKAKPGSSYELSYGAAQTLDALLVEALDALAARDREIAELRADAERYRWLRDGGDETWTSLKARARLSFPHVPEKELSSMVDEIILGAIERARGADGAKRP